MHRFHGRGERFARDDMGGGFPGRGFGRGFGRGRHGPEGRHEGRDGRRERMFDHGDLRFVLLALIAEKPSHGYEIIKAIEDRLGGAYSPSPGVVYPTLTWLEELGYATVEHTDGGRKLYAVTDAGRAHLEANRAMVDAIFARMSETRAQRGDIPAPVLRAMENLRTALRLKLAQGPLSPESAQTTAEAIDAAALAVERS